jgi:hypothetical protein
MKSIHKLLALTAATGMLLGSSCLSEVGSGSAMFVVGTIAPLKNGDGTCSFIPAGQFLLEGVLDIGPNAQFATSYQGGVELHTALGSTFRNQTVQQREQQQPNYPGNYGTLNSNVVVVERARIAFSDERGVALPQGDIGGQAFAFPSAENPRVTQVGAVVFNENQSVDAEVTVPVPFVSLQEAQALSGQVPDDIGLELFVTIVLEGRTSGGGNVSSPEFTFPIFVCKQCLIGINAAFDGANFVCADGTAPEIINVDDPPCSVGQDERFSQCLQ